MLVLRDVCRGSWLWLCCCSLLVVSNNNIIVVIYPSKIYPCNPYLTFEFAQLKRCVTAGLKLARLLLLPTSSSCCCAHLY